MNTQKKSDSKPNSPMTRDAGARMLKALMVSSSLALAAGCGSTDPGEGDDGAAGESGMIEGKPFLPLTEGNRWVYQVTQDGITTEKTTVVGPLETVGGSGPHASAMAHRMTTSKGVDGTDETIRGSNGGRPTRPDEVRRRPGRFRGRTLPRDMHTRGSNQRTSRAKRDQSPFRGEDRRDCDRRGRVR